MIVAFYHLLEVNNWYDLAAEQLTAMARAGFSGKIFAHLADGSDFGVFELQSLGWSLGLNLTVTKERGDAYEQPTIFALKKFCADNPGEHQILYFHGKNVTRQGIYGSKWRWAMMGSVVLPWRERIEDLRRYDACGFCLTHHREYGWIFAGNFWWARADWIRRLPEPFGNRFSFESWVLSADGWNAKSLIARHGEPCQNSFYSQNGNPQNRFLNFMANLPPESPRR